MLYALVRSYKKILFLQDFTLERARTEMTTRARANSNASAGALIKPAVAGASLSDGSDTEAPAVISAKAKGKQPERGADEASTSTQFAPTEDWVSTWKPGLRLATLLQVLRIIAPRIELLCATNPLTTDQQVLRYLRSDELTTTLPKSHDKLPRGRQFQWVAPVAMWFRSLLWSQCYLAGRERLGIWNHTQVQLFQIKADPKRKP